MKRLIYADNAATTQLDICAFEAMKPYLLCEYGNASQPYSLGRKAKQALKEARSLIASSIGAQGGDEIIFTSCGTESDNLVIKGFSRAGARSLLITSSIEHHAILNSIRSLSDDTKIIFLPVNNYGEVSCTELSNALEKELALAEYSGGILVSIMSANNEIGTIQPIKELAQIAHSYGAKFHTDAVQAIGHIEMNMNDLDVDYLSASAHKFNGPKGVGFLYIKEGNTLIPLIDGGSQEKGIRAGTENIASIVGMSVALKNNLDHLEQNTNHILQLEDRMMNLLRESGLQFIRNGSKNHIPGNISLSFKDADGEMILHRLDLRGICISTGSACDSKNIQLSHVISAIGVDENYSKGTIRITLGKNNSLEDIDAIVSELVGILIN